MVEKLVLRKVVEMVVLMVVMLAVMREERWVAPKVEMKAGQKEMK